MSEARLRDRLRVEPLRERLLPPRMLELREPPLRPLALRELPPRLPALRELPRLEPVLRLRLPPRELLDCDDLAMLFPVFCPGGFSAARVVPREAAGPVCFAAGRKPHHNGSRLRNHRARDGCPHGNYPGRGMAQPPGAGGAARWRTYSGSVASTLSSTARSI